MKQKHLGTFVRVSCARMHSFAPPLSRKNVWRSTRSRNSTDRILSASDASNVSNKASRKCFAIVRRSRTDNETFYFQTWDLRPFTFVITTWCRCSTCTRRVRRERESIWLLRKQSRPKITGIRPGGYSYLMRSFDYSKANAVKRLGPRIVSFQMTLWNSATVFSLCAFERRC